MTTLNFQPTQKPLSLFFTPGGNAGVLGYDAGHQYQQYVPQNEAGYIHRHEFVREYRSWHNDPRISTHQWNEELNDKRKHRRRRSRLEIINKA